VHNNVLLLYLFPLYREIKSRRKTETLVNAVGNSQHCQEVTCIRAIIVVSRLETC